MSIKDDINQVLSDVKSLPEAKLRAISGLLARAPAEIAAHPFVLIGAFLGAFFFGIVCAHWI